MRRIVPAGDESSSAFSAVESSEALTPSLTAALRSAKRTIVIVPAKAHLAAKLPTDRLIVLGTYKDIADVYELRP